MRNPGETKMPNTSKRLDALPEILTARRKRAGLSQAEVAKRLGRSQSYISAIETGRHRVTVVDLMLMSEVIGFDPVAVVRRIEALASAPVTPHQTRRPAPRRYRE